MKSASEVWTKRECCWSSEATLLLCVFLFSLVLVIYYFKIWEILLLLFQTVQLKHLGFFWPVCKPASLCAVSRGTGTPRMGILICSTRTHTHTHTDKSLHLMLYLSGKCWPEAPLLQNTVQHKHKATYDWIEGILSCELNQKTESSRVKRKPTEETLKNSFWMESVLLLSSPVYTSLRKCDQEK